MASDYGVTTLNRLLDERGFDPTGEGDNRLLAPAVALLYGLTGTGGSDGALLVNDGEVDRLNHHHRSGLEDPWWVMRLEDNQRKSRGMSNNTKPDSVLMFKPSTINRASLAPGASSNSPDKIVIRLTDLTPEFLAELVGWDQRSHAKPLADTPTEVQRLVWARSHVGQRFREKVLAAYGTECAFCDLPYTDILEAAHIIPWSEATEAQRIDVRNGVLLCPNCHSLFDRNLLQLSRDFRIVGTLDKWAHREDLRLPPEGKRPNPDWIDARKKP